MFCFGTVMPAFPFVPKCAAFIVLLLLYCCVQAEAVCSSCFGAAPGCTGDPKSCPWTTDVGSNVTAIAAAAGGVLTVAKLLPRKLALLFNRITLQTLSLLNAGPKDGTPFEPAGKSPAELRKAVGCNSLTKEEACAELAFQMEQLDFNSEHAGAKMKALHASMEVIKSMPAKFPNGTGAMGCYLFILYRLSAVCCTS